MTDLNKEREEFESDLSEHLIERDSNGFYLNDEIQNYWEKHLLKVQIKELKAELEKAKAQAVLDTQQKLTDTYYLEGSDYVVDCPFEYDIEIDKGEVLELQKWQRTESTKVYFANIYKDEDNFEILQFASKAEAENAVAENLKFLEVSESGAEG
ncbi:hypothetical protein [Acinetobacter baumannii]|uniref:hypothetical protein n=1 Tax=Acinetobacter baumannii TaxID=470 RepID=UPI003D08F9C0